MATSDSELLSELRDFGQIETQELSDSEISTAISRAKRHLRAEAHIRVDNPDWYSTLHFEDALFWSAVLFVKVVNGDLDAKGFDVGDISEEEFSSSGTIWFRNYKATKDRLEAEEGEDISNVRSVSRTTNTGSRYYTRE